MGTVNQVVSAHFLYATIIAMMLLFKKRESTVLRKKVHPRRLSQLQIQIVIGIVIAITIALLLTTVYYSTRINSLQIRDIQVIGGQTIPHSFIEDAVNDTLDGTYFKLVPRHFRPLYPREAIIEKILQNDRVKNVHVEIIDGHTLVVAFDEYTPFALWCAKPDSTSCMFMDTSGYAFAQAPELEGSAFVRYIQEGKEPVLKSNPFDSTYIKETGEFVELLKSELNLYVTHVTKQGTYDIEYQLSGGGVIKVSQTKPLKDTFSNLETILHSKEFANIEPGSFQYIDLRFGDKVFVNEVQPVEVGSTTSTTQ